MYGVFDVEPLPDAENPNASRVKGMVEKPDPTMLRRATPLPGAISSIARSSVPCAGRRGAGGEIQLTDAIALLIAEGIRFTWLCTVVLDDLGNPGGYLKAAVDFALIVTITGLELRRWLVERLGLTDQ